MSSAGSEKGMSRMILSIQSKLHVRSVEDVVGSRSYVAPYTKSDLRTDRPGYNPMIGRLGTDSAVAGAGVGVSGLSAMPPAKIC